MTETTPGREPVQIVKITQPFCANTFGEAPCTATNGADTKCYNTRATCRDPANFALGPGLDLYFSNGSVAAQSVPGVPYIIPSLRSVSTTPSKINLSGGNPDASGLGTRALCRITFADHPHTDRIVDPYVDGRSWSPMSADRGSFWTRWIARNRYRQNIQITVYEGYAGQSLSEMVSRVYFWTSIDGPKAGGLITVTGKDILAQIEERKAQAPVASPGVLFLDIDDTQTSFSVANALLSEYDASGTIRIGSEIMTYTAVAQDGDNIAFSGVVRGTDGTTADSHDADAGVQQCLRYTLQTIDAAISDLMTSYGGVDASWLDLAGWTSEASSFRSLFKLTRLITEPQSVTRLVSEVCGQSLVNLWWDERARLVRMRAVRGVEEEPDTLTDATGTIAGSFILEEKPRERVSRVVLYYDPINAAESLTDPKNFRQQYVLADLESETDLKHGEASIKTIFATWLPTGALVQSTASNILTRYVDNPWAARFRLDAKDRAYWVGDVVLISHYLDVDEFGARNIRQWRIVSAEETRHGDLIEYVAEDTTLYGVISTIMPAGSASYDPDNVPFLSAYIGDADGLLSDGTECARVA